MTRTRAYLVLACLVAVLGGFLAARAVIAPAEPERPARADGHPDADHPGARAGLRGRDTGAAG